jgi:monoamine oxidase
VVVLEADDRVGGRSMPGSLAGYVVDLGGQWVARSQDHLLALAKELGVQTYPQYVEGENILDVTGREARYKEGEDLPLEPADLEEFNRLVGELEAMAGKLDVAAPWTVEGADGLDAQTFENWLQGATTSEPARAVFRLIAQTIFRQINWDRRSEPVEDPSAETSMPDVPRSQRLSTESAICCAAWSAVMCAVSMTSASLCSQV